MNHWGIFKLNYTVAAVALLSVILFPLQSEAKPVSTCSRTGNFDSAAGTAYKKVCLALDQQMKQTKVDFDRATKAGVQSQGGLADPLNTGVDGAANAQAGNAGTAGAAADSQGVLAATLYSSAQLLSIRLRQVDLARKEIFRSKSLSNVRNPATQELKFYIEIGQNLKDQAIAYGKINSKIGKNFADLKDESAQYKASLETLKSEDAPITESGEQADPDEQLMVDGTTHKGNDAFTTAEPKGPISQFNPVDRYDDFALPPLQGQHPGQPYDLQGQHPGQPYDLQGQHPGQPYDLQGQHPGQPYDLQGQHPGQPYDLQGQHPGQPYDLQGQHPGQPYDLQGQHPGQPYDLQGQHPGQPYDYGYEYYDGGIDRGQYDYGYEYYDGGIDRGQYDYGYEYYDGGIDRGQSEILTE